MSFATLGGAFSAYLAGCAASPALLPPLGAAWSDPGWLFCFAAAAVAGGLSLASLANPSPLSLVPAFTASAAGAPLALQRDDAKKLRAFGLTRITRHPLVLPVLPWGLATTCLAGGRAADALLLSGLAVYAVCGCYAQVGEQKHTLRSLAKRAARASCALWCGSKKCPAAWSASTPEASGSKKCPTA